MSTERTNTDPVEPETSCNEKVRRARGYMLDLGRLAARHARIERAPRMPDGRRETDVEHSFHLGITACELASMFYPDLDTGLIAEFSNVHDLPEVITGDVWTFRISDEERARKEAREAEATELLFTVLPPHIALMLKRYEMQQEPEARFVRLVDKGLPAVMNIVGFEASTFHEDHQVASAEEIAAERVKQAARMRQMFPEFARLLDVRYEISMTMQNLYFPSEP